MFITLWNIERDARNNKLMILSITCAATLDGKAEVAKVLLDGGANVNTHDKQGRSVLMVNKCIQLPYKDQRLRRACARCCSLAKVLTKHPPNNPWASFYPLISMSVTERDIFFFV